MTSTSQGGRDLLGGSSPPSPAIQLLFRRATELSLQGVLGEQAYTVYSQEQRGWLDGLLHAK